MSENDLAEFEKWLETAGDETPAIDVWPALITDEDFDPAPVIEEMADREQKPDAAPDTIAANPADAAERAQVQTTGGNTRTTLRSGQRPSVMEQAERMETESELDKKDTLILDRRSIAKQAAAAEETERAASRRISDTIADAAGWAGSEQLPGIAEAGYALGAVRAAQNARAKRKRNARAVSAQPDTARRQNDPQASHWILRSAGLILLIQAICEIFFAVQLIRMNLLPARYLIGVIVLLVILFLIPVLLLHFRRDSISLIGPLPAGSTVRDTLEDD